MSTCLKKIVSTSTLDDRFSWEVYYNGGHNVVPILVCKKSEIQSPSTGFPALEFIGVDRGPGLYSIPVLVRRDTKDPFPFGRDDAINNLSPEEMERLINT